jgi:hypothetical protein
MGNEKSIIINPKSKTKINYIRNVNTEGTQGLMTLNTEKNIRKDIADAILSENRKNIIFSKRESIEVLINKNKGLKKNKNNKDYEISIEKENKENKENNNNLNNIIIPNSSINYNRLNKNMPEYNTFEINEKELKNSQNSLNSRNKIIKEKNVLNTSLNKKEKKEFKKLEFNNITIIDNLSNYFPKNISKEEIKEFVDEILYGRIVDDQYEVIQGQKITREQADALAQIIYEKITKEGKNISKNNYSVLENINVRIGMTELNKETIEKIFFQGYKITEIQNEIIMKNLAKGKKNVKVLYIELL